MGARSTRFRFPPIFAVLDKILIASLVPEVQSLKRGEWPSFGTSRCGKEGYQTYADEGGWNLGQLVDHRVFLLQ